MYKDAVRSKLRFQTKIGQLSAEDLWDLPLLAPSAGKLCLDDIAIELDGKVKAKSQSFVVNRANANREDSLRLAIVKDIIETKLAEADEATEKRKRKEERDKLVQLLNEKELQQLNTLSVDEIKKRLADLG
jgi:hypothetical protein